MHHKDFDHRRPFISAALRQRILYFLMDCLGVGVLALGLCLVVALFSYDLTDPSWNVATEGPVHNVCGVVGSYVSDMLMQYWGKASFLYALDMIFLGWLLLRHQGRWMDGILPLVHMTCFSFFLGLSGMVLPLCEGGAFGLACMGMLKSTVPAHPAWILISLNGVLWCVCLLITIKLMLRMMGLRESMWQSETWKSLGGAYQAASPWVQKLWHTKAATPLIVTPKAARVSSPKVERPLLVEPEDTDLRLTPEDMALHEEPKPEVSLYRKLKSAVRQGPVKKHAVHAYELPPLDCLSPSPPPVGDARIQAREAQEKALLLESVLKEFGVSGSIVQIRPGPVVTLYELRPAPGTKSSRVVSLADDIARSMSALSARVAPIPGRDVIGIELPNSQRETVFIRDILISRSYETSQAGLPLILGKDIGGEVVIADLARMPHLLVAGTTGSGKSVAVNSMILSLLYRMSPQECRLIMIDPKMLELSIYDGIPHLLTPVVTDPKKAITALKWVVKEMENRYRAMSQMSVRNITGYNQRVRDAEARGEVIKKTVQTGFDPETGQPIFEDQILDHTPLPYIVVVVDEMADLMLVAGKEIEAAVQRLAQMARAAGIHIIMATQRPSVDVITGTIKANFPTRISFQVTSKIDSRTILNEQGAEQLLGQGDMLYMASGGRIVRLHGPYVHDADVERVVSFLRAQGEPDYVENLTEDDQETTGQTGESSEGDELYQQAVELVRRTGKASTSFVQRHFQVGYNRAARLIEKMEQDGVISQANHVGKREVLR